MAGLGNHPRTAQKSLSVETRGRQTLSLFHRDPWQDQALCAQVDPELFFPEKGDSVRGAKLICSRCPVRQECLEYALGRNERFGVWGGFSERERRRLRRGIYPKRYVA